jgi:hypothetical protein
MAWRARDGRPVAAATAVLVCAALAAGTGLGFRTSNDRVPSPATQRPVQILEGRGQTNAAEDGSGRSPHPRLPAGWTIPGRASTVEGDARRAPAAVLADAP